MSRLLVETAKLRQHRGLFASEDLGTLEKFRPYGVPTESWLDEFRRSCKLSPEKPPE